METTHLSNTALRPVMENRLGFRNAKGRLVRIALVNLVFSLSTEQSERVCKRKDYEVEFEDEGTQTLPHRFER